MHRRAGCTRRGFGLGLLVPVSIGCGNGANPLAPFPTDALPTLTFSGPFAAGPMAFHQQNVASR